MSFESLGLSPALVRATAEQGYAAPTPIQRDAIPAALRGPDLIGSARTGSGKTAAFVLPVLQLLSDAPRADKPRRTHTLVLVPTRELAAQVGETFRDLARHVTPQVKVATVFGGVSINPQMMALRGGADVVVATPGRLLDLLEHNAVAIDRVAVLVLDEADRMLDAGFADELARVLAHLPARRQNLLFSATFPAAVQALASGLMRDPVRVDAPQAPETALAPNPIAQRAIEVEAPRRTALLHHLIRSEGWDRVLVFVATRHSSELVAAKLRRLHVPATAFHGWLSQGARTEVLAAFSEGRQQVVVATDMAARGLDIPLLPVVVNYDLPRSAVDHVHRIGRTGRAGESGLAVSFVSADTEAHFRLIEKRQGRRVPREQLPGFETEVGAARPLGAADGGVKGVRKSKKDKLREAAAAAAAKAD